MFITELSIKRPAVSWVMSLILIIFGLFVFWKLPLRELPNGIQPPVVQIQVDYKSAAASIVDQEVTQVVEDVIGGAEGIKNIDSKSENGRSTINVEFVTSIDLDNAANDIRERVARVVDNLPSESDPPQILKRAAGFTTTMWLSLSSSTWSDLELGDYAERYLVDQFSSVKNVGRIRVGGLRELSIRVWIDPIRLAANDLTIKEVETAMREEKLRYESIKLIKRRTIIAVFKTKIDAEKANNIMRKKFTGITRETFGENDSFVIRSEMLESEVKKIQDYAINQNLTTLRNRVNELGVSEPVVQRQGKNRIVVELPGVQDTAAAKRIIGKTANLEFRLEAKPGSSNREKFSFSDSYVRDRGIKNAYLKRTVVITGDHVSKATAGYDEKGTPNVNISLNSQGGARMHRMTRNNIGQRLGVLFIEYKVRTKYEIDSPGEKIAIPERYVDKNIINLATIQSALGVGFQITGLSTPREASELALFLRAGAMAAPMYFVEERTIGPSLGAENIALGIKSVIIGMSLVIIFMLLYYRVFGLFANVALTLNLLILVAFMSMLEATLTLPGIAGIVLTVGIAVDANVLIFSRIKEEIANGLPPQSAISAGYDRAFVSIVDANITTLIVAVILFIIGSGPVQGFAVTLSIGILVSMFTAIVVTRALVNLSFGNRAINKIRI